MPDPDGPSVTVTVEIDANPDLVYGLITDLPTLASLAEEVVAMQLRKGDDVRKGAVFVGRNENGGRRWTTTCTVTDADPGRVFAFDVRSGIIPISRWQYGTVPPQHVQHHGVCTDGIELRGIQDPLAHDGGVVLNCRDERNLL